MSWTPQLTKEAFQSGFFLTHEKTKKKVKVYFCEDEPCQIVTKHALKGGDMLRDSAGHRVVVLKPEKATQDWPHKVYYVAIIPFDYDEDSGQV